MNSKKILTEICYPEELPAEIRTGLEQSGEGLFKKNGRIYLALEDMVFCCDDDYDGNELVRNMLHGAKGKETLPRDKAGLYLRMIQDSRFRPDTGLIRKLHADPSARGSVAVYKTDGVPDKDLYIILSQMAPLEEGDMLLPINYQTVAFIRQHSESGYDELRDYTEAVIGSAESEGIPGIRAGIGRDFARLEDLRKSYREACTALSTGIRYHEKGSVYEYGKQAMERILDCIPEDKLNEIRREYCSDSADNSFSDEILETVRVFFRNDLNLTAAARELFIHRNTLNYRLDKIRKETGLDLRSFQDAVIFRILYGIREQQ